MVAQPFVEPRGLHFAEVHLADGAGGVHHEHDAVGGHELS